MKITVQLVIDAQDGTPPTVEHVTAIARDDLSLATAGLALTEAHEVLSGVQHHLLTAQARVAVDAERHCQHCGRARARKDTRQIVLRTLFGTLRLDSPRLKTCSCTATASEAATFSPIAAALPERTAPELLLWEAKYAALTSYGTATTLLAETFPLGRPLHATALRQQVERTATRLENELGEERFSFIDTRPRDLETMPRPDLPLVVALDGGYVHSANQTSRRDGWFEAVTGRSTPTGGGPAKTFAFVQTYDHKPKRRLYELLRSQGMTDNQQIVFLTDGGEDIRDLPRYLNPQAEHYLDWFHITMRLTVLRQSTQSLPTPVADVEDFTVDPAETDRTLERIKHYLWHGNTFRALDLLTDLVEDYELLCADPTDDKQRTFFTRLSEFRTYIDRNQHEIPNYGERHRNGEAISSATAEATVNHVISRRMVKKQQMRWTPRGAHLLLQIRTRVLNHDLETDFARWYPNSDQALSLAA
ncbi:ISKra4 family transposase [Streptosporangium sp. NPDC051023]|uniref:ISKra4 family transposase n=1 Tax=Streptosporangium sp. NPDC051023 TaxID=3155410 RepID=UPI00344E96C5